MADDLLRELAECLKQTVHMARAYAHGTGSLFEFSMTSAERLADRVLLEIQPPQSTRADVPVREAGPAQQAPATDQ